MRVWRVIDNSNSNGNHTDEQRRSLEELLKLYTGYSEESLVISTRTLAEQEEVIGDLITRYGNDLYLVFHSGDGGVMQGINVIAQYDAEPTIVPLRGGSYNIIYARYAGFQRNPLRDLQRVLQEINQLPRKALPLLCIEDEEGKKRYGGVFVNGSVVHLLDDYENGTRADAGTVRLALKLGVGIVTLNDYHRQLFKKTPMGVQMIAAPDLERNERFPRERSVNVPLYAVLVGMYPYLMNSRFTPFYRKMHHNDDSKGRIRLGDEESEPARDKYSHVILEDIDLSGGSWLERLGAVYTILKRFHQGQAIPNHFDDLCERMVIHANESFPYTIDGEISMLQTTGETTPLTARAVTISTRAFVPCIMLNRQ